MGLSADTIAASIAGLSISGVTIKGLTNLPSAVDNRETPVLAPSVNDPPFMTALNVVRDSFGGLKTITYTLNWKLYAAPIGSERSLLALYPTLVSTALAVLDAIIANDALTGSIDVTPEDVPQFGPVSDPSGNQFHGAVFAIRCMEFSEV